MTSSSNESTVQEDRQQLLTETEKNGYVIVNPTTTGGNIALVGTSGLSHHPNRATDATQQSTSVTLKVCRFDCYLSQKIKIKSMFIIIITRRNFYRVLNANTNLYFQSTIT
ncbi:unnamed protein product [Rotaria magnacalcarata]|uniref:Uncharacterized protein n=2 Tax=Rotaria magnacalcarata TaxID=392030 RepID=A0A8S3KJH4_9BILA|nr:unnamed protein product [Rotaria magnacalcarata]